MTDTDPNGNGGNPAWSEMLGVIPEDLHEQVTPLLQKWDQGVQQRFSDVHSKYDPYKELVDSEIDPQQLKMGLGLLQAIEQDPKQVYEALAQQFNLGGAPADEQGNTDNVSSEYGDLPPAVVARLKSLEQGYETVASKLNQEDELKRQAVEDARLEQTMAALRTKHGEFHEGFVLSQMLQGQAPDDAVAQWNNVREQIMVEARRPQAPKILGSGSVIPGEQAVNVKKLDSAGTKSLVASMLEAAKKSAE